ncbi:MAG: patatin-like phospholipase family protein, partial [Prolixibacteraceae bacterium]|nr:patatin-like phospholipase family protein [Prolixibacteraceae bacterium]
MPENKNVALVLSSGGARGIAHIGVIEELQSRGYVVTSVSGTSMGALIGGMLATGKLEIYKNWMCSLDKMDVFSLVDFTVNISGIVKGNRIIREMKKMIPDTPIEKLQIPYSAVATDVLTEKEIIFTTGSLYEAIRASISIPSVFIPHQINGWQLIDGGVINPIPINRVKRNGADILVVVNLYSPIPHREPATKTEEKPYNKKQSKYLKAIHERIDNIIPKNKKDKVGYINLLNKTSSLMIHKIAELTIERYQPDITIEISRNAYGTYEFYRAKEIIETGREAARVA